MVEVRGRPFAFVTLTLVLWTSARIAWPEANSAEKTLAPRKKETAQRPASFAFHDSAFAMQPAALAQGPTKSPQPSLQTRHIFRSKQHGLPPALVTWQVGGRPSGLPMPLRVAGDGKPLSAGRDTPPTIALALAGKAGPPEYLRQIRWQIYAYSFWRGSGASRSTFGPSAQYGGSQSGVIATLDPFGDAEKGVALLARAAVTPDGEEREVAMGLRLKPGTDWPLHLTGEYRLRANAPDRFAAYVAGGFDIISLTDKWTVNGFGQAGYVSGRGGGGFFDAQSRLIRPMGTAGRVPLTVGVGAWAGGQQGSARVDIGPTIAARIEPKLGSDSIPILIQLDYRLRVAGNATPGNGLALTLSTGF